MGYTIESLKQQALTRKAREICALDEQIALQAKILAGFQASFEVAARRKLNIERMKLQNEMLRRDVEAIDAKMLDKKVMSNIAQRRANRRNALKSSGPRTETGKRRASLNSVSHGLSAPADPAWREGKVSAIEGALQGERLPDADVIVVAEAIFEVECNIAHQREIYTTRHAGDDEGAGKSIVIEAEVALTDEIDEMLMIDERHGGPDEGKARRG
ncbi:hypothetical protein N8974_00680 [bacterium]|nr:hypothetical protein [bacterium]